jgi:2'-5' RNA ligase
MATKRLFFAVDLSDESLDRLVDLQESYRRNTPDGVRIRWTPRTNMHLTLKFLGSHEPDLIGEFAAVMNELTRDLEAFGMRPEGLGAFPHPRDPRILWVGVDDDSSAKLAALHRDAEEELAPYGVEEDEHPFKAHITIGRVKSGNAPMLENLRPDEHLDSFASTEVDAVTLYESELDDSGATYHVQHRSPLAG